MPGLVPGIYVFIPFSSSCILDVDGRNNLGHDD